MVETAEVLAKANINKTIILTGAMIPYAFGTSSDGFFNLGASLAFVQTLDHGVYISMNGSFFNWDNVRKNKATGYFEKLK
jgi:L-asparaginase